MFGSMKEAAERIGELVRRFGENQTAYRTSYNEESTRNEFIDPLFEALGWDVSNTTGAAEQYKDCVLEGSIKVGGVTKAPDYSFRIGGQRKFFVEAKKPAVSIGDDRSASYQLRRYAWSAKLPISIVTNFAEFAVYDTRVRPKETESAVVARIEHYKFDEYLGRLDEMWGKYSKEAVLRGYFDRFVEASKLHKGTKEVDDTFLTDIESWRDSLAHNIAPRNLNIGVDALNFVVQATVDRLIFLRIAEDRGIEPDGQLRKLLQRPNTYRQLCTIYRRADAKYNSGLFDFRADATSLTLEIDDKTLAPIIEGLYYPKSPYEFSIIPVEILGNVYERFLGKVIRLTPAHYAKVEEKPEVRKAGGVFYTPLHIVDAIVEKTIGALCQGKAPSELESMTIVDPACGSGSFLLGAYSHLLRHHLEWYQANNPGRRTKQVYLSQGGWRLTSREKKRILLTHIYGVDIDAQAVEVTKLSLLLKVMEGETEETLEQTAKLFAERALPSLERNIRCGNSLISPQDLGNVILGEQEKKRVNAFNWRVEFAAVMTRGGFDAVIGNPPYVRIQTMKQWAPLEADLYKHIYASAASGNYDIYTAFVEKGLSLLKPNGHLSFILPHKFFNAQYGRPLRSLISTGSHLREVVHFGDLQIFRGATTYTCLLFLQKAPAPAAEVTWVDDLTEWRTTREGARRVTIPSKAIGPTDWDFVTGTNAEFVQRLRTSYRILDEIADIFVGVQTSADDVFIVERVTQKGNLVRVRSKSLEREVELEAEIMRPLISGTDAGAFVPLTSRQLILYPYLVTSDEVPTLMSIKEIGEHYPRAAAYLLANKSRLESREKGKFKDARWHRFGRSQNLGIQGRPKVCVPRLVDILHATLDEQGTHVLDNVDVGGVTLKPSFTTLGLEYLCGLLNSSLLQWYFPFISAPFRGGFYSANRQFLGKVPIRILDLKISIEAKWHNDVTSIGRQLRALSALAPKTPHERTRTEREKDQLRHQLDLLIFEIYALSAEEVSLVEVARAHSSSTV
jgi:type I restriction-modification system DNA methylase subunit